MAGVGAQGHIPPDQKEAIIELLMDGLATRMFKSQLKKLVRQCLKGTAWGDLSHVAIEKMITEAKRRLRDEVGISREEGRASSIALYESIIRDPDADRALKIRAQERIDKVLGLEYQGAAGDDPDDIASQIRAALCEQNELTA